MLEILIIAFGVILSVGVWFFVLEPLLNATSVEQEDEKHEQHVDVLEDLYARRDALYTAIKELEFDRRVGKISEEDFQRFSARLKREAADVLRQIEDVKQSQAALRERLEAQIQALVAVMPNGPVKKVQEAEEKTSQASVTPRFCTQCGHRLQPGDRFCSRCGSPVREMVR